MGETQPNVAASLVLRYLLPTSVGDQLDAFRGLCAVCKLACRGLFLSPEVKAIACNSEDKEIQDAAWAALKRRAKQEFVETELLEFLAPYRNLPREEIERFVNQGKFAHIANRIRSRLLDQIDRRGAEKRQGEVVSLETPIAADEDGEETTLGDTLGNWDGDAEALANRALMLKGLADHRQRFVAPVGERGYEALRAMAGTWPDFNGSWPEIIRAIAEHRRVSRQQARADFRELIERAPQVTDPLVLGVLKEFCLVTFAFLNGNRKSSSGRKQQAEREGAARHNEIEKEVIYD